MDGSFQRQHGGSLQPPHGAAVPPPPTHPDLSAPSWAYGLPPPLPGGAAFGGPGFAPPYGFDPSVPPPSLGCPPTGPFPIPAPTVPVNAFSSAGVSFQAFPPQLTAPPSRYEPDSSRRQREDRRGLPCPPQGGPGAHLEAQETLQRRQDQQWLAWFLQGRGKTTGTPETKHQHIISITALRDTLSSAAQLVSQLEEFCHGVNPILDSREWSESYQVALQVKEELRDKLDRLSQVQASGGLGSKLSRVAQRRSQRLRAKVKLQMERKHSEEHRSEKEAAIDTWRMRQIQQVEEKKKEQELKLAADAVLCEVRKKQADVKRMQDVLRSLEKLRRLRTEAASRKGIVTAQQCSEAFSSRLDQLLCVMKRRTRLYSAEEKALMVMLEGEQEEERKREQEKRVKKERERQLERRRMVDSMLFGDELPAECVLQPFTEYYSQAEHSLQALIRIRREWDVFLVPADHPAGSSVPQSWVLPDPPSDQVWASALHAADTACDDL